MATIPLEYGLALMVILRSVYVFGNELINTDNTKYSRRVLSIARQFSFLAKYLLVPLLWSTVPIPVAFPLSMLVLYAFFLVEARAASFYRIRSNQKRPSDLYEMLDKYAPMWLNPDFDPELREDANAVSEYKSHQELDSLIINSGFEGSKDIELPARRTAIATATTWYQSYVFLYQTFNYNMKALASLWRVAAKWVHLRFYKPNSITADSIAEMMVNSEIGIFSHVETCAYEQEEGVMITFDRGGFALPYNHLRDRFDNRLRVSVFIPEGYEGHDNRMTKSKQKLFASRRCREEITTRVRGTKLIEFRMRKFSEDGVTEPEFVQIKDKRDMIHILAVLNATVCHPIVHSLNDLYTAKVNFAQSQGRLARGLSRIVRYGNAFNDLAYFAVHVMRGKSDSWSKTVVAYNSGLSIPFGHEHKTTAQVLAQYSRLYSFLHGSHDAMMQSWAALHADQLEKKRMSVPQFGKWDFEVFFQLSVSHSAYHFCFGLLCAKYDIWGGRDYNGGFLNYAIELFYKATIPQFLGSNLVKDNRNVPLFNAIYRDMVKVDPTFANRISVGISE